MSSLFCNRFYTQILFTFVSVIKPFFFTTSFFIDWFCASPGIVFLLLYTSVKMQNDLQVAVNVQWESSLLALSMAKSSISNPISHFDKRFRLGGSVCRERRLTIKKLKLYR